MKYFIILGDGMADEGAVTPLDKAHKPTIDNLACLGELGMVKTVDDGFKPGSDVANLSVLGYSPALFYSGRAPIEAASMGVQLKPSDLALRCNLVTLSDEPTFLDKKMVDYSAGEISTAEAAELVEALNEGLISGVNNVSLYSGVSYRHLLVVNNRPPATAYCAPHDITGQPIADKLPKGDLEALLLDLTHRAHEILKSHPVNLKRISNGKRPANSVWFWGEGTMPSMPSFKDKTGLTAAMISAVDLLKGIGILTGMSVYGSPEFTGNIHTNLELKVSYALEAIKTHDLVYLHVEAPDECGHQNDYEGKVKSIEYLDSRVVAPILREMERTNTEFSMLIMPDHATPCALKTHTNAPVPYIIYRSTNNQSSDSNKKYTEKHAAITPLIPLGHTLIDKLITPKNN